ncbi:MAG: glycosyltransferase family 2 protein [Candidatus Oxydemutatoraceae bacterium WSBS_2016_MAG_OTU14]
MQRTAAHTPPLVSVVLATYQRAQTLSRAVESILAQTLADFELIIVDDGSEDETAEVIKFFAKKDQRVKGVYQANQGLPAARNYGVRCAEGRYIAFMDDDDASAPTRLEAQVGFLEAHPDIEACTCQTLHLASYKLTKHTQYGSVDIAKLGFMKVVEGPYAQKKPPPVLGPATCLSKQSYMDCEGYRETQVVIEDLDFTLRFLTSKKMAYLNDRFYHYYYPKERYREQKGDQGLCMDSPAEFIKKHIVCYISEWCRYHKRADPVEEGKTIDEILPLVDSLSTDDRYIIYDSLKYFAIPLSAAKNISVRQAENCIVDCLNISIKTKIWWDISLWIDERKTRVKILFAALLRRTGKYLFCKDNIKPRKST